MGDDAMALVTCPSCGRKCISDSVVGCPSCGYNIRKHFQINPEELERLNQKRQQEQAEGEILRLKEEESQLKKEQARFEEMEKRAERTKIISGIAGVISCFIMIYTFAIGGEQAHKGLGWIMLICFFAVFFSVASFVSAVGDSNTASAALSKIHAGGMKELRSWQHDKFVISQKQIEAQHAKDRLKHPTCPLCGSNNTVKIGTLNRGLSVAFTGLASSKIGKQYECKECHHKW